METLVIIGSKYLYIISIIVFGVFLFRLPKEKKIETFIFSVVSLTLSYIVSILASCLYNNPRPFVSDHITPLIPHVANNGFPSDHTLLVATIASILYYYNRTLGFFVFVIAMLVGASRVLAGVHHWIDIVGSFGIAVLVTFVIYKVRKL